MTDTNTLKIIILRMDTLPVEKLEWAIEQLEKSNTLGNQITIGLLQTEIELRNREAAQ